MPPDTLYGVRACRGPCWGALDTRLLERLDTRERLEMEPTGDEKSFTPPNQTRVVYTEEECPQGTLQLCCCSIEGQHECDQKCLFC